MVALNPRFALPNRSAAVPQPASEGSALRRAYLRVSRSNLPASSRAVLKEMLVAQGGKRVVSVSKADLAAYTGLSESTVKRALAFLKASQVVRVTMPENRQKALPPIYRLILANIANVKAATPKGGGQGSW